MTAPIRIFRQAYPVCFRPVDNPNPRRRGHRQAPGWYGKRHYGDGLYKEAARILDVDSRTLENCKQIADRFSEITLRNVDLTYNHQVAVWDIALWRQTSRFVDTYQQSYMVASQRSSLSQADSWG